MISRVDDKNKLIFARYMPRFQEAFETKIFDHIAWVVKILLASNELQNIFGTIIGAVDLQYLIIFVVFNLPSYNELTKYISWRNLKTKKNLKQIKKHKTKLFTIYSYIAIYILKNYSKISKLKVSTFDVICS